MYPYNSNLSKTANNTKPKANSSVKPSAISKAANISNGNNGETSKILAMIEEALGDELHDYEYYRQLHSLFDDANDKEIIRHISLDELKHKKMLEELYRKISGKDAPVPNIQEVKISRNLLEEISKSIANEYEGSTFYRTLYFLFQNPEYRDIIFEIMNDELIHAGKLTYLYAKNRL